jgi:hypothetical protein
VDFVFLKASIQAVTASASYPVKYQIKWQGREADHSPPSSAEVKKL